MTLILPNAIGEREQDRNQIVRRRCRDDVVMVFRWLVRLGCCVEERNRGGTGVCVP